MMRNESGDHSDPLPKVQSVHRALRLLKLMTVQGQISVAEAASELGVHASSAQRLLATLVGDGFAVQDGLRQYLPGPEFLEAGRLATTVPLPVKLRPALERLYTQVRETVHAVTLIGTNVHHIDGIRDTSHALQFGGRIGVVLPAHITSTGRAMLAQLSKTELEDRYLSDPDNAAGVKGLDDMESLYRTVILTRQQGMGMNFDESEEGVAAFGTAVGIIDGQRAGLSIAMPSARFKKDLIPHFRTHLDAAAAEIRAAQENPLP